MGAHVIAWIFLGVMVFSLAYYQRGEKVWGDEATYRVQAQSFAFGAPEPWLIFNSAAVSGAPPPLETLPGGIDYLPGVRVDIPRLCIAVTAAFAASIFLFLLCWASWPSLGPSGMALDAKGLLAIASSGALVGAVSPTDPPWIGAALGLALVPAVIAGVCWRRPSFVPVVLCSATGVLCMVWVQRLSALFWSHGHARDFDLYDDVYAPAAMFALYALGVLAVVTVKRLVSR